MSEASDNRPPAFPTSDAIANAVVLTGAVLLPAWMLAAVARRRRAIGPPRESLANRSPSGRIKGVSDDTRNLLTRASFRESRRRYGAVMEPMRVFAHHPKVMVGYAALEMASERSRLVSARLKHLAELRAGMICGCEWCLDFGSSISAEAGISEEELRELPTYHRSLRFTELEKLVLDYATGMTRSPVAVSDELFDRLREHFDEAQLVELTNIIALENYRARFNWALGIEGQGFSEGAFCVPPEVPPTVNDSA
jgi:AhpD family alkylhydroperoxidase